VPLYTYGKLYHLNLVCPKVEIGGTFDNRLTEILYMAKLWIKAEKMTKPKYAEAPFSLQISRIIKITKKILKCTTFNLSSEGQLTSRFFYRYVEIEEGFYKHGR
jgi:hypothetical protein